VPIHATEPLLDQPPGLAWFHVLAFVPLDPETVSPETQVYRARLVSVAMSLLALGSVFWAGLSISSLRTAVLASLVFLANPLMVMHGRMATAEAVTTGWAMLAFAAALWAIRPLRPAPKLSRQGLGWGLCGLSLGLATLTAGPTILPPVMLPLMFIGMVCPRRLSHTLGLAAAGAIAALMTIPWAIYVHQNDPTAWEHWAELLRPPSEWSVLAQAMGTRSLALFLGSGVWGLLVLAALVVPWRTAHQAVRRQLLVGWVWAVSVIVLVVLGPVLGQGARVLSQDAVGFSAGWASGVLLAVPVLALVTGQMLGRIADLAGQGRLSKTWNALRWPTAAVVLAASIAGPIVFYRHSPNMATMHLAYWIGAGAVLVLLGVLSLRWAMRPSPGRAVAGWSMWTVVATTLVVIPASQGSLEQPHARRSAELLRQQLDNNQIQWQRGPTRSLRTKAGA